MAWQPAPVLFPDAELVVAQKLRTALRARGDQAFVGRSIPNPRPDRLVAFIRDGGAASGVLDSATLRCRVFEQTEQKANDLARLVVALMQTIVDGVPVVRVEHQSGPYEVDDESEAQQRYLLFEVTLRGEALNSA